MIFEIRPSYKEKDYVLRLALRSNQLICMITDTTGSKSFQNFLRLRPQNSSCDSNTQYIDVSITITCQLDFMRISFSSLLPIRRWIEWTSIIFLAAHTHNQNFSAVNRFIRGLEISINPELHIWNCIRIVLEEYTWKRHIFIAY